MKWEIMAKMSTKFWPYFNLHSFVYLFGLCMYICMCTWIDLLPLRCVH